VERFRGELVFKARRLLHRSTLGLRVIEEKKNTCFIPGIKNYPKAGTCFIAALHRPCGGRNHLISPRPPLDPRATFGVFALSCGVGAVFGLFAEQRAIAASHSSSTCEALGFKVLISHNVSIKWSLKVISLTKPSTCCFN